MEAPTTPDGSFLRKKAMAASTAVPSSAAPSSPPAVILDSVVTVPQSGDNHHGIPTAVFFVSSSSPNQPTVCSGRSTHSFVCLPFFLRTLSLKKDDIPTIVRRNQASGLIEKLSALSQKYRFFEEKLTKSKDSLAEKIAEVERALRAVKALQEKSTRAGENAKDIETQFELSDGIYISASIPPTKTVCLWLGANVMVEYTHQEAIDLLTKNLGAAQSSLADTCADINYLRDQVNTTDVNLSRVFNHHVQTVRSAAAQGRGSALSSS